MSSIVERCIACNLPTMAEPSIYRPRADVRIQVTLCAVCRGRLEVGDKALLETIEFRLLITEAT